MFQQIQNDEHEPKRASNLYWPFCDRGEWSLGKFLVETMTQTEIDRFLKLSWTTQFEVQGYTTVAPINLIWHNGLEVAKSLFGNPIFAQNMSFDPLHVWEGVQREYGEWFTANQGFSMQLPEGATIMPIIAASDKTPVTRQTGGPEMHPLFLTISNIDSDVCMKATSHAWQCVAYIPIPKFETHSDYHTILKSRVWHNLKVAAKVSDELQYCFTPLVAWIADLPEQLMIASVSKNTSPITLAAHKQFGDANCHNPHTVEHTLELLYILSQFVDPWNLDWFQKKAKELLLLGMHLLFWRDWPLTQVFIFLVPEILHTLHKFFFDHLFDKFDAHYKSHHKCIGVRHFSSGISHVAQMTEREHREIQHTIVTMISGAAPPEFVRPIHALINFMYQAQNPIHTESTIEAMQASLPEFHDCKAAILEAEVRQGESSVKEDFYIPKLKLLLSFAESIRNNGGLIQFTADISERLLITHCKSPFTRTSKQKDFGEQIVHILDCQEQMRQFDPYILLCQHNQALINAVVDEDEEVYTMHPTMAWVSQVAPDEQHHFSAPRPICNHFTKGILSNNANAALTVTRTPDCSNISWPDVMHTYGLPDLHHKMFSTIKVWSKFCIQLHSTFRPSIIMPSRAVQAQPPSDTFPSGNCDVIFLDTDQSTNNPGFAQVHIVFQLAPPQRSTAILPDFLLHPLLYPKTRTGFVIPIMKVTHATELVPVYGEKFDRSVTSAMSQEHYDHFYLNHYADKEIYNVLHESLDTEYTL
ncbi:uncharacterized protein EDB91DRAFT_1238174 [Suillus paluster]|uniref:uncharacterized protein n=1 Tax=Suillus paluster TaxID=48578 RepID=UPI001B87A5BB|nr:uncharacterized protein EDB91DRAFT_1238174 [Suillus paluster]KAG1735664.1 hypothetical protein EDB91DRAFT_1238174 [Suillus paluster]